MSTAELKAAFEAASKKSLAAQAVADRAFKRYQKSLESDSTEAPWGLAECLETYLDGSRIENTRGYEFLKLVFPPYSALGKNGSYWSDTNQYVLTVTLKYGSTHDEVEDLALKLEAILWAIKPGKDGAKRFSVSEDTLCEYGIYQIEHRSEEWALTKTTYGSTRDVTTGDLRGVLNYCLAHHPKDAPRSESIWDDD